MKCRFLLVREKGACAAGPDRYAPSAFETKEYCTGARHRMCPFYCMASSDGFFDLKGLDVRRDAANAA